MRCSVASHKPNASDVGAVVVGQLKESLCGKRFAAVLPQILAVASWALAGTGGEVDGKRHFVGKFLEYDIVVGVFDHGDIF